MSLNCKKEPIRNNKKKTMQTFHNRRQKSINTMQQQRNSINKIKLEGYAFFKCRLETVNFLTFKNTYNRKKKADINLLQAK